MHGVLAGRRLGRFGGRRRRRKIEPLPGWLRIDKSGIDFHAWPGRRQIDRRLVDGVKTRRIKVKECSGKAQGFRVRAIIWRWKERSCTFAIKTWSRGRRRIITFCVRVKSEAVQQMTDTGDAFFLTLLLWTWSCLFSPTSVQAEGQCYRLAV